MSTAYLRLFFLLLFPCLTFSETAPGNRSPESFAWIAGSQTVAGRTWTKSEISTFLQRVTSAVFRANVGDFEFIDLLGDGRFELLASVDDSGRAFFNHLLIVSRDTSGRFETQDLEVWNLKSLRGVVRDLKGDGKRELIVPVLLTPYLGARPYALWYQVYVHKDAAYVDADNEFSTFYKTERIPQLQKKLAALQVSGAPRLKTDAIQLQLDKANRASGTDPKAGLETAITWAEDSDPMHRIFAIFVLSDMGGEQTRERLITLTHDADPLVRNAAECAVATSGAKK